MRKLLSKIEIDKTMWLRAVVVLAFFGTIAVNSVNAAASSDPHVSIAELKDVLRSENYDPINKTLNDVKSMSNRKGILPFIRDLWELRKDRYTDVPWNVVNDDIVRLGLADVLLQARSNRIIEFDPNDMSAFAVGRLRAPSVRVRTAAMFVLAVSETDQAVTELFKVAKREHSDTYRAAILALIEMCNPRARQAIAELQESVKDRVRRKFIRDQLEQWENFNKGHPWCN